MLDKKQETEPMTLMQALTQRLGNPLDWSSSSKALLLLGISVVFHLQYTLAAHFLLGVEGRDQLVNVSNLERLVESFHLLLGCTLALFATIPFLAKALGEGVWYEYVAALYYGLSLCFFSYTIGTMTLPTGAALAGTPVVGFIFFHRGAILTALGVCLVVLIGVSYATAVGALPYAPIILAPSATDGQLSLFWMVMMFFYTAPHLIVLILLAYYVLRRWRQRENEVRLLSLTDSLTGLANRRSILSYLGREQDRSRHQGPSLSVLLVDLDHFKMLNDTYGHPFGDQVLARVSKTLRESVRQNDQVGRFGGEEFLIVLPGTDVEGALFLAERCRAALAELHFEADGRDLTVTASFGLFCNHRDQAVSVDGLLRYADEALYRAKEQGRNCIVVSRGPAPSRQRRSSGGSAVPGKLQPGSGSGCST